MQTPSVLVIGGGVAGLSAALELADQDVHITVIEKSAFFGGHAIQYACKATGKCVKCGICLAHRKLDQATRHSNIRLLAETSVQDLSNSTYFKIRLFKTDRTYDEVDVDAVVVATGFSPYMPEKQPYGYRQFKNTVTHLELEQAFKNHGRIVRPSDGKVPRKIAFIQCVGSRDKRLNHLWCSKVCCSSAFRMARLIKSKHADTEITFFYRDIQTFGKDFNSFYERIRTEFELIPVLPGYVHPTTQDGLKLSYFDKKTDQNVENSYDLIVLSIAMTPCDSMPDLSQRMHFSFSENSFAHDYCYSSMIAEGIFLAGSARGPMSVSETILDAANTAFEVLSFIKYCPSRV